ncbi:MAG: hypothetical protein ABIU54_08345 [Candidatus Eisenbacteria bacterium]
MMRRVLVLTAALMGLCASLALADDHARTPAEPTGIWAAQDGVNFAIRIMEQNLMGLSITNYGFIGNNFVTRSPSMEYPLGTGYEHLVRGGLWIGGLAVDDQGAFTGVTTGAVDGSQGSASANATEFTPVSESITSRSTLPNSRYYNTAAVSELDFLSTFWDGVPKRATGNNEDHRPLRVQIRQENYAWSFSDYQHFVIFHYVIKNVGAPIRNLWVGMYDEFQSGPKNAYSCWPPSSQCSSVGSWFSRKYITYTDSLRMLTEQYCATINNCNRQLVPYSVGLSLLGVRPGSLADTASRKVTFASWSYAPGSVLRDEDREKYDILASGTQLDVSPLPDSLAPPSGDPVTLLGAGPFVQLDPGDSITVDFAYVGGTDTAQVARHTRFAQRAYDRNYIVPVPPPSPRFTAIARDGAIDFYWENSPEAFLDPTSPIQADFEGYRLYVGEDRNDIRLLAQFDKSTAPGDTTGFNTGFAAVRLATPEVIDGQTYQYKYTLRNLRNGFKYYASVTSYDLGNVEIESLESGRTQNELMVVPAPAAGERPGAGITVFPNPYRVEARWDEGQNVRDHYLWFANLPSECTIRIYTLSGDLVYEYDFKGATYDGRNARGIYDPRTDLKSQLSGASFGWDMITRQGQAAATGLYMYSVEDKGGKKTVGKFLIVKSDREGLN